MSQQLLINVITATVPAYSSGTVVPHGLRSNGKPVAPTLILPKEQGAVIVASVNATNVYLDNPSDSDVTVTLRCERGLSMEVDADTVTPFFMSTGTGAFPSGYGSSVRNSGTQSGTLSPLAVPTNLTFTAGYFTTVVAPSRCLFLNLRAYKFVIRNGSGSEVTVRLSVSAPISGSGLLPTGSVIDQQFVIPAGAAFNVPPVSFTSFNLGSSYAYVNEPVTATLTQITGAATPVTYEVTDLNFFASSDIGG